MSESDSSTNSAPPNIQFERLSSDLPKKVFVDRVTPKRVFEDAALSIPRHGCAVKVWHGVGGQGKSALAKELFKITNSFDPSYSHLRCAMLNLGDRDEKDPDRLLVWIRNAFSRTGVGFEAFDLAFAIMWDRRRGDEPLPTFVSPWLRRSGEIAADMSPDLVLVDEDLLNEVFEVVPLLGPLMSRGVRWGIERLKLAWLKNNRSQLDILYRDGVLIDEAEMASLMPWMLAQDMNRHLEKNESERFVLYVDEYESVTRGTIGPNRFDESLRLFIQETDGLLACFFSRQPLHWVIDTKWRAVLNGNQYHLEGLESNDADDWLQQVPIRDSAIRSKMIEGAREIPDQKAHIFPFMLNLQIEHWRNLGREAKPEDFNIAACCFSHYSSRFFSAQSAV